MTDPKEEQIKQLQAILARERERATERERYIRKMEFALAEIANIAEVAQL